MQAVVAGDTFIVPANTPHQFIPADDTPLALMTFHVPYPPAN